MKDFAAYSMVHWITLVACVVATAGLVWVGLRLAKSGREGEFRRGLGWFGLAFFVVHQIYWCTPPRLSPADSLPLHICDLNGLIAPLALLTRKRWLRSVLYFWGIGLSLQGLIQPVITEGPATSRFWFFFSSHWLIVGYAVYDVIVGRYRPAWRDLLIVLAISLAYFCVMIPLDIAMGWNYGFFGKTNDPSQAAFVRGLGAWPLRLVWMFAIGAGAFVVLWLPWEFVREWHERAQIRREVKDLDLDG